MDPRLLRVLEAQEISVPTPIQAQAIPFVLERRDVVGVAQTGTGKTLGYVLPSLTLLAQAPPRNNAMLVLTPTRELAIQVHGVLNHYGKAVHIRSAVVYGGVSLDRQAREIRRGRNVIVATPGRLLDHIGRGNLALAQVEILVLDEADRMLDMGFLPDIRRILHKLPRDRQTLMFSATFPPEIARLARELLRDPAEISIGTITRPVDTVRQLLYPVNAEDKTALLLKIIEEVNLESAVIFLRTRQRTERLAKVLKKKGVKVAQIHGDRSQQQREQALSGFRTGKYKVLVATDVAARGLDIEGITHVVNYDIPPTADDYIHRIGRTARAQAEGDAITFVTPQEYMPLENIERALGQNLPRAEWNGAAHVISLYTPATAKRTRGRGGVTRPGRGLRGRRS